MTKKFKMFFQNLKYKISIILKMLVKTYKKSPIFQLLPKISSFYKKYLTFIKKVEIFNSNSLVFGNILEKYLN